MVFRCLCFSLLVSGHALAAPDSVVAKLAELSGVGAKDCSIENGKEAELAIALGCVKRAVAESAPFTIVLGVDCADCNYWTAAAGNSEGALWHVTYDSKPTGSPSDEPKLSIEPCSSLHLDPRSFPFLACVPKPGF